MIGYSHTAGESVTNQVLFSLKFRSQTVIRKKIKSNIYRKRPCSAM